jgi:hypothetical protein
MSPEPVNTSCKPHSLEQSLFPRSELIMGFGVLGQKLVPRDAVPINDVCEWLRQIGLADKYEYEYWSIFVFIFKDFGHNFIHIHVHD